MWRLLTTTALLATLAPGMAWANTITVSNHFNFTADNDYEGFVPNVGPMFFNTSLGTLTGEKLTVSGHFTPGNRWWADPPDGSSGTYPKSVPVILTGDYGFGQEGPLTNLAPENLTAIRADSGNPMQSKYVYTAKGTPESFTASETATSQILPEFDVGQAIWTSDFAAFNGSPDPELTFKVKGIETAVYTYTPVDPPGDPTSVPEPGALALLAVGLLGIGAVRRRG